MNHHTPHLSFLGKRARQATIADLMERAIAYPNILSVAAGFTANEMMPVEIISEIWSQLRARSEASQNHEFLQYGVTQGRLALRKVLANRLSHYSNEQPSDAFQASHILISNGSQQSLYLTMQVLCDPGDIVLVEGPSYFVFLELLQGLGIQAISMPTTSSGHIDFEGLKDLLDTLKTKGQLHKLKAIYLVSYYANPSSRCLSSAEKNALGHTLSAYDTSPVIMEDAAYRELYFDSIHTSPSIHNIPSLAPYTRIYYGTFTKPFATGLKIGFACVSSRELLDRMLAIKAHHDFGSPNFNQAILETMLTEGYYEPFLQKQRAYYKDKAQTFDQALQAQGLKNMGWQWESPTGGLFIWLRGPKDVDTSSESALCQRALKSGVLYVPGNLCFAEGTPHNCIRLSFGTLPKPLLEEAAKRLGAAIRG